MMRVKSSCTSTNRRTRTLLFALVLTGFSFSGMALPPNVAVSKDRLSIDGVTPGSSVALLGIAHEPDSWMVRVVTRRELLTDDDHDGRIEYVPPKGVAFRSTWIVTDLRTGETTIAAPAGYKPQVMVQKGAGRGKAVDMIGPIFDIGRQTADILVVRPGRGAWTIAVRHAGTEPGAAPGRMRVHVAKLRPLRPEFGAAPAALIPGDVVAIVDQERIEYWLMTISAGGR